MNLFFGLLVSGDTSSKHLTLPSNLLMLFPFTKIEDVLKKVPYQTPDTKVVLRMLLGQGILRTVIKQYPSYKSRLSSSPVRTLSVRSFRQVERKSKRNQYDIIFNTLKRVFSFDILSYNFNFKVVPYFYFIYVFRVHSTTIQ